MASRSAVKTLLAVPFFVLCAGANAQYSINAAFTSNDAVLRKENYFRYKAQSFFARKLFQRNTGMILGLQRGMNTWIEFGAEAHWRKISLLKPHIIGATANVAYNLSNHVVAYQAGGWMKRGRVNLTYGANVNYYDNFKGGKRFGFGPSVGFRLMGFHLINGYNFLTKDKATDKEATTPVNSLYMSLRYYFPVQNRFTWDRKTMKKKRERKKERARRKKERQNSDKKGLRKLLNI